MVAAAAESSSWSPSEMRLRQWVLSHPGACRNVADACDVSAEYVRLVLYGKRGAKNGKATTATMTKVKRMLKQKGAPVK